MAHPGSGATSSSLTKRGVYFTTASPIRSIPGGRGAGGSDQVRLGRMRPRLSRPMAASVLQLQLAIVAVSIAVAATAAALKLSIEFVTALLRLPAVLAVAINLASQFCFGLLDAFTALVVPIACHGGRHTPTSKNAPNTAASRAVCPRFNVSNMISFPATMMTSGFPIVLKSRAFEEANRSSLELSVQKGTKESQPRFGTFQRRLSFLWAPRVAASGKYH